MEDIEFSADGIEKVHTALTRGGIDKLTSIFIAYAARHACDNDDFEVQYGSLGRETLRDFFFPGAMK